MLYTGIDYSMTSPAVCLYNTNKPFSFENCQFVVVSDKKISSLPKNIKIVSHSKYITSDERYHNIWIELKPYIAYSDRILIEDYSMGSKGKVFHIAENTEVLQYNLFLNKINYEKIPPTSLKKFATGKGNSNKDAMYKAFIDIENIDLLKLLGAKNTDSPISDIVDSYFLTRYIVYGTNHT